MTETHVQPERTAASNGADPAAAPPADYPVTIQPMDGFNRKLLDNTRPRNWQNPTPDGKYNLVVIGAGTAGLVAAIGAAGLGAKVALIERELMGGDCLNWGCVPSKSIIRPADIVGDIRKGRAMGIHTGELTVDFSQVMGRMRDVRADISHDDSVERVRNESVELYLGSAAFTGPDTIEVTEAGETRTLHFARAVIATGGRARVPSIPGLRECDYLTNETLFQLTERPERMAIIGSGPIGSEMAQAFARLGTRVTLLERAGRIMTREDADAAEIVQAAFVQDGVELVLHASVQSVEVTETGTKIVHFEQDGESRRREVDALLVSVGRAPNIESLNLEVAGVEYTERGVTTDDTLQTTNPKIYASGDVAVKYQFTHMADATSRIVLQNALFPGPKKKASDLLVPWCTYTDPEVAHVGLYEHQAQEQGIEVDTFVQQLSAVDRARTDGDDEGFVKIHVKKGTDKILGATIVSSRAGEMISEITTAMAAGAGLKTLSTVIHPYPTQSEAIKKIADAYNRTRLTPLVKTLFSWWMRWQR